jgi:hypothetical protein
MESKRLSSIDFLQRCSQIRNRVRLARIRLAVEIERVMGAVDAQDKENARSNSCQRDRTGTSTH